MPVGGGDKRTLQKRVSNATILEVKSGWARVQVGNPAVKIFVRGIAR